MFQLLTMVQMTKFVLTFCNSLISLISFWTYPVYVNVFTYINDVHKLPDGFGFIDVKNINEKGTKPPTS